MDGANDISADVDERVERLICRCLDGEADAEERAELAGLLLRDPAARAVYEEYRRIDELAGAALRRDVANIISPRATTKARRWRVGLAAAILTTAAVVAISALPRLWSSGDQFAGNAPGAAPRLFPAGPQVSVPRVMPYGSARQFDFVNDDHQPFTRLNDLKRDVIGIRGKDDNRIYIFERDTQSTKLVPVSGDI